MPRECRKPAYADKRAVQTAINHRSRSHRGNGWRDKEGGELRGYYCRQCRAWHITSKPFDQERRDRDRQKYRNSRRERRARTRD